MMYRYYNKGFYIEGVHSNIPQQAISISEEYYQSLLQGMSDGMELTEDQFGYPLTVMPQPSLEDWKKGLIGNVNMEFVMKTEHTPLTYPKNGLTYYSEYSLMYSSILNKYKDEIETLDIWDSSNKIENIRKMNKAELLDLARFLASYYEEAFQNRKRKISYIESLDEVIPTEQLQYPEPYVSM